MSGAWMAMTLACILVVALMLVFAYALQRTRRWQ